MGAGGRTVEAESPALIMHRREYNLLQTHIKDMFNLVKDMINLVNRNYQ